MKFKYFSFFIILFLFSPVSAQRYLQKAESAFRNQNYAEGIQICKETYDKIDRKGSKAKSHKGKMAFYIAECYRETGAIKEASDWYEKAILLQFFEEKSLVYYYNAEMKRMMGDIDKAQKNYKKYKDLEPNDKRADVGIESCEKTKAWKTNSTKYEVKNETVLNKGGIDMCPVFGNKKTSELYFSSSRVGVVGAEEDPRSGDVYMDIWVSELDKSGNWTEPHIVNELVNTEANEGAASFDGRFKTMFFTRCPNEKKKSPGCEIWMSKSKGKGVWEEPTKIMLVPNDNITVGHPCASGDGKTLIFVSDLTGGQSGRDLWMSTYNKRKDKWSMPVNLGPEINTPGNEMFPTLSKGGNLYFASDGHPGLGGLDIFLAKRVGEEFKFEDPVNMGVPLNSSGNDYYLIEYSDKKGYFTSERKNRNGGSEYDADIYSYELPPNYFDLKLVISQIGEKNTKIADAVVKVKGSDGSTWQGYTNNYGSIYWTTKPNGDRYINENTSYEIEVSKEGYYENNKKAKLTTQGLKDNQTFFVEMGLLPIKSSKPIRLPEIRNVFNSHELVVDETINSKDSLNFVYDLLMEYPGMVLELSSHTDSRGNDKANQGLSERRAKECVRYLVEEKGINSARLVGVGKGEALPAIWKDPESGEKITLTEEFIDQFKTKDKDKFEYLHSLNRRTEGRVLSMDFQEQLEVTEVESSETEVTTEEK